MRLVIEVSESDRDALRKYLHAQHPSASYSALFRALLRLAIDGTVPRAKLKAALAAPHTVLNVTVAKEQENTKGNQEVTETTKQRVKRLHGWDI